MGMKFKGPIDSADEEGNDMVVKMMESVFGKENVRLDIKSNTIHIHSIGILIAIKD